MPKKAKQKQGEKARLEEVSEVTEQQLAEAAPKEVIRAQLLGNLVVVSDDYQGALAYYDKGNFGELQGAKQKRIEYSLEEALYLLERERIAVYHNKKKLSFEQFLKKAVELDKHFWTRYQVYKDIRTRGYVTKTALKFGADFRVYRRGVKPGEDHAKWVLYAMGEKDAMPSSEFAARNRVAHSTRKKLLIGIVDAEGDVTYYEIRWTKP